MPHLTHFGRPGYPAALRSASASSSFPSSMTTRVWRRSPMRMVVATQVAAHREDGGCWLRGPATSGTCSCGMGPLRARFGTVSGRAGPIAAPQLGSLRGELRNANDEVTHYKPALTGTIGEPVEKIRTNHNPLYHECEGEPNSNHLCRIRRATSRAPARFHRNRDRSNARQVSGLAMQSERRWVRALRWAHLAPRDHRRRSGARDQLQVTAAPCSELTRQEPDRVMPSTFGDHRQQPEEGSAPVDHRRL